ncbi:ATP-dependent nuclease [Shewanella algae]
MYEFSIKIKNYKCFKDEAGFDDVRRVNLIIGKNNAGKSSLLDIVEFVANGTYEYDQATWRDGQRPQIIFRSKITEDIANRTFPSNTSGGPINGNHGEYGRRYINRLITWTKTGNNQTQLVECDDEGISPRLSGAGEYSQRLTNNMPIPLQGKTFRRVLAERDIVPEIDNGNSITIQPNGNGITNAIQCFINRSNLPSELVEIDILNALNEIFAHDATFTDIVCQLHESNFWEIYLEEEHKGRIALSKSGSGLKTVITVLSCIFLAPKLDNKSLSNYVFGFEELENNIHPALLRRLNDYLYRSSVDNGFVYFLTTHSNVLIDQFSKQDDAQILHITQVDSKSSSTTATTYVDNNGILDDLDVRASDLLQANGVIWVEGPSDRIYLNRWIELWSDGALKEGTHYQIIFYGGRLLSHLSAEEPEIVEDGISILNANRNAIILIDSDKRNQQARINATKQRIRDEFYALNAICWITRGKEIENYISSEVVNSFLGIDNSESVEQYGSFFDHVDSIREGEGNKFSSKKPLLAEKLVPYMTIDNMGGMLDLDERLRSVCEAIRNWNS